MVSRERAVVIGVNLGSVLALGVVGFAAGVLLAAVGVIDTPTIFIVTAAVMVSYAWRPLLGASDVFDSDRYDADTDRSTKVPHHVVPATLGIFSGIAVGVPVGRLIHMADPELTVAIGLVPAGFVSYAVAMYVFATINDEYLTSDSTE